MENVDVKAGRKEWLGLVALVIPCLIISMDLSILYFALPHLTADLNPSSTQQLWIMDGYGFLLASFLITMGSLGDRVGRRLVLLVGAAAFAGASALAAFASTPELLIVSRALMGIAAATLMPSTLSLIRAMFLNPTERTKAIAAWNGGLALGAAIGPVAGGFLLEHFWWGSVFLVNVPVMVLLLIAGPLLLPEVRDPAGGRLDLVSVALSVVGILSLIHGIKETADHVSVLNLAFVVIGLVVITGFVLRQSRISSPLIELDLFKHSAVSGAVAVNVVSMFTFFGCALFTTQHLQLVLGYSTIKAGLWFLAAMPLAVVAMVISVEIAKKVKPGYVVAAGLVIGAAGAFVLTLVEVDSPLLLVIGAQSALTAGLLIATTLTADTILTTAPPEQAGSASALTETGTEFGSALGIALLGTLGAVVYRNDIAVAVGGEVPPEAAETFAGAVNALTQLPAEQAAALLAGAREAFTNGTNAVGLVGTVVMLVGSVLAVALLRRIGTQPAETNTPAETKTADVDVVERTI